jgi:TonB family protein
VGFLIGINGAIEDSKIDKSSGFPALDKAALEALQQCKYKSAILHGVPAKGWTFVKIQWEAPNETSEAKIVRCVSPSYPDSSKPKEQYKFKFGASNT